MQGTGFPENYEQAYVWWDLVAAQSNENAKSYKSKLAKQIISSQIA